MRCSKREEFLELAGRGRTLIPVHARIFSDHLTPVVAYRRLVAPDERSAPSFLLESVEGGQHEGRHSFLGARPVVEVSAAGGGAVRVMDRRRGGGRGAVDGMSVVDAVRSLSARWCAAEPEEAGLPRTFLGGWVGYCGYDTARQAEPTSLPLAKAPRDDRGLADVHFGLYRSVAVFDHVTKVVHVVAWVAIEEHATAAEAYESGAAEVEGLVSMLQRDAVHLPPGSVMLDPARGPMQDRLKSTMTREAFEGMVRRAQEYIRAGDIFQVVLSQRFDRVSKADPFEVYRGLRIVNPSPYMIYLQTGPGGESGVGGGCILVASSPEILCRVREGVVVNRPLAGTRRRGATEQEDEALAEELLADPKERAEHIMLVDLGRNDVGRVSESGSVRIERRMEVERYSHVMHISSTVTGRLGRGLDEFDALRAALPAGTVSGAPKIRAMQIIDELEPLRRGPYGGGIGCISFGGDMDMALALRTMVAPTTGSACGYGADGWVYHLQAGAGVVLDSNPSAEYQETVNKAAALARAIDLAEEAFGEGASGRSGSG